MTNITNKQARTYREFTLSDRYGFKSVKSYHTELEQRTSHVMWLFLKSTYLVHPSTPHHSGTPLENFGTPWGVRYTRLASTGVEQTGTRLFCLTDSVWPLRSGRFGLNCFGLSRFGHGTFRSWSFLSRDISVRLWNLAEILYGYVLKSTKGFIWKNCKHEPRSNSSSAWTYDFRYHQQAN